MYWQADDPSQHDLPRVQKDTGLFIVQVEIPGIVEDLTEPFVFTDRNEGQQFVDHLRDLYELYVDLGTINIDTYGSAIERMVEVFGPSPD